MVELVDDDEVKVLRVERPKAGRGEALDGCEHGIEPLRSVLGDPKLTEAWIANGVPEGRPGLLEDLLPMCDEQQSRSWHRRADAGVVHGCHDGLSRSGRGDEQVPVVSPQPRHGDLLEEALLKRSQVQLRRWQFEPMVLDGRLCPLEEHCPLVRLEVIALPVGVKDCRDLGDHIGVAQPRHSNVPLQPGHQARCG